MSKSIAVLNQKGGVGKTTTVVSIGTYLAKSGKRVLIVDFDPQGNATSGLGLSKDHIETTSGDILFSSEAVVSAVQETEIPGLSIIASNSSLASVEVDLVEKSDREFYLKNALASLDFDYILIDCPPALGLLTINALTAADNLIIPVQAEYYALEGLSQLLDITQRVRKGLNKNLELMGVVVTMYDGRNSLSEQVHNELKKHFGDKLFKTIIPRNVRLAEAPSFGRPISEHDKWSKGARAYKQLTKEILRHG